MTQKLDFEFFYLAAKEYEQEKMPLFWQMRQDSPEIWSSLVELLQNIPQTESERQAFEQLVSHGAQPEVFHKAMLQCSLPLLTRCVQKLKGMVSPLDELEVESEKSIKEPTEQMAQAFVNLIEAHAFASLVSRAPAMLHETLAQLHGDTYTRLQSHFELPEQEADLSEWLHAQSIEQLEVLKAQCSANIESVEASHKESLQLFLTCLNSLILPRQLTAL